jgi:hypothetical protein
MFNSGTSNVISIIARIIVVVIIIIPGLNGG